MRYAFLVGVVALVVGLAAPAHAAGIVRCATKEIHRGDRGRCVLQAGWLLGAHDPALRHGPYWRVRKVAPARKAGPRFVGNVRAIKWRLGYPAKKVRGSWGPTLRGYLLSKRVRVKGHDRLVALHPLPLKYRIRSAKRHLEWDYDRRHPKVKPLTARVKSMVADANYAIAHAYSIYYTQSQSHREDFRTRNCKATPCRGPPLDHMGGDCSGTIEGLYYRAGLPDPSGPFANYYGATSTQQRGVVVWQPGQTLTKLHPGDLVFYGYPIGHVSMVLDYSGHVFSHGSDAGPLRLPALYRSDARLARRYF